MSDPHEQRIRAHMARVASLGLAGLPGEDEDEKREAMVCDCGQPAERPFSPGTSRHSLPRGTLRWCASCRAERQRYAARECQRRRRA